MNLTFFSVSVKDFMVCSSCLCLLRCSVFIGVEQQAILCRISISSVLRGSAILVFSGYGSRFRLNLL